MVLEPESNANENDRPTRRLRFSIRSLLILMSVSAICLWAGPILYDWYTSIPLSDVVDRFNEANQDQDVGRHEPALTTDEVLAAIAAQLPKVKGESEHAFGVYAKVLRSERVPATAQLVAMPGYNDGIDRWPVWWINLDVTLDEKNGYGLRIRHTNHPSVANGENEGIDLAAPVPPELLEVSSGKPDRAPPEPHQATD